MNLSKTFNHSDFFRKKTKLVKLKTGKKNSENKRFLISEWVV
jgi:hypothetical protein